MSRLLDQLKAKYPKHKILSEPDTDCGCKGAGERRIKPSKLFPEGRDVCCLCICLSGDRRAEVTKAFGQAAKRVYEEQFGKRPA
jgi:hypothetical protein